MRVFISWSGAQSRQIAQHLRRWLGYVMPSVEPFMSDDDIDIGRRWGSELAHQLEASHFGVVVLTPGNQDSQWLSFEAGALGKSLPDARVVPLLFGLKKSAVTGPLSLFQMAEWTAVAAWELLVTLNSLSERPMEVNRLHDIFDHWWPELANQVEQVPQDEPEHLSPLIRVLGDAAATEPVRLVFPKFKFTARVRQVLQELVEAEISRTSTTSRGNGGPVRARSR